LFLKFAVANSANQSVGTRISDLQDVQAAEVGVALFDGDSSKNVVNRGGRVMMTIIEVSKKNVSSGQAKVSNHKLRSAMPMINKIIGRCKADRRAIETLDKDQQEYLRRNAKTFLAARMKKSKTRNK
jgi:hypothetical protein